MFPFLQDYFIKFKLPIDKIGVTSYGITIVNFVNFVKMSKPSHPFVRCETHEGRRKHCVLKKVHCIIDKRIFFRNVTRSMPYIVDYAFRYC